MMLQGGTGLKGPSTGAVGGTVEVEVPTGASTVGVNTGSTVLWYPVQDGKAVIPVPSTTPAGQPFVVFVPNSKRPRYLIIEVVEQ